MFLGSEGMLGSYLFSMLRLDHEVVGKDILDFDIASADDCRCLVVESEYSTQLCCADAFFGHSDGILQ
ncbi:MAG: hypothetical protein C0399_12015 [Syntrophus sp. (in: bacteria)]|nr:hypothetical protein [Syntrophus sp. (in: bacteria)]